MDIYERVAFLEQMVSDLTSRTMNMASRGTMTNLDDTKNIQQMAVQGVAGEQFNRVQRWEQFGISSLPPAGSDALIMSMNGSRDSAQILAVENQSMRPRNSPGGSTTVYDAAGTTIVLDGAGKLTINANDVEITSSTLTHNGVDISDDHIHRVGGSAAPLTGIPNR